jgi:hypothetical protein
MSETFKVGNPIVVRLNDGRIVKQRFASWSSRRTGCTCKWIMGTMRPR